MNTLQAEKLRDLIAFLEKLGAKAVKVELWDDDGDCLAFRVKVELWKGEGGK